ncbi:MAG: lysophospholipase [Candidatus Obscuribacterales bacterium]|nr:lysophospholipase [Candidatus Obscuribacterales bacterium]
MQKTAWHAVKLIACQLALLILFSPAALAQDLEAKLTDDISTELGIPIYSWASRRQADPKAIIVALHGATLHARSYSAISRQLSELDYAVFATDMRGFGSWYKGHDDPKDPSRRILYRPSESDLKALLAKLRQLYPSKPIFLMGESVGANMAVRLVANNPDSADGMILSSPGIKQRFFVGPTVVAQVLTIMFKPRTQLSIEPFLRSRVSENPQIADERISDPLARNRMNIGELVKTRWFNKESLRFLPMIPEHMPVLVLEGTKDKLFEPKDIEKVMDQLSSHDKTLHWLKNKGHIHLETVYLEPEVVKVVSDWLADKTVQLAKRHTPENKVSAVIEANQL